MKEREENQKKVKSIISFVDFGTQVNKYQFLVHYKTQLDGLFYILSKNETRIIFHIDFLHSSLLLLS